MTQAKPTEQDMVTCRELAQRWWGTEEDVVTAFASLLASQRAELEEKLRTYNGYRVAYENEKARAEAAERELAGARGRAEVAISSYNRVSQDLELARLACEGLRDTLKTARDAIESLITSGYWEVGKAHLATDALRESSVLKLINDVLASTPGPSPTGSGLKEARREAFEECEALAHNYRGAGFGPTIEEQIRALKERK